MDVPHRRHDNVLVSLNEAGLGWARQEVLISQSLSSAPFGGSAHFQVLKQSAMQFFASHDSRIELFLAHYEKIAWHMHSGRLPPDYGSQEHVEEIYWRSQAAWPLWQKGVRSKAARWFQVFDRERESLDYWGVVEMILLFVGLTDGWANLVRQPGCGLGSSAPEPSESVSAQAPAVALPPAGDGVQKRVGVMNSNRDAKNKLQDQFENYMHCCFLIYQNAPLRAAWVMLDTLTAPIRLEHGRSVVLHKSVRGCREWSINMARPKNFEYLDDVLSGLCDEDAIVRAGLLDRRARSGTTMLNTGDAREVSDAVWRYIVSVLGHEIRWCFRYNKRPPNLFCRLLDPDCQQETLDLLQDMWALLAEAERASFVDHCIQDKLDLLLWSHSSWLRELFVALDEAEFADIPEEAWRDIEGFASCHKRTKVCEDAFNLLRDKCRHSKEGVLGRKRRHSHLLSSQVLEDCDRDGGYADIPEIKFQPKIQDFSGLYERPGAEDFSLCEGALDSFQSPAPGLTPSAHLQVPFVYECLRQCRGRWDLARKSWLSLLAQRGSFIRQKHAGQMGVVLMSSPHGVLLLSCSAAPATTS